MTDGSDRPQLSRRLFVRSLGGLAASSTVLPWLACEPDNDASSTPDGGARARSDAAAQPGGAIEACPSFLTPTADFFVQFGGRATVEGWQMPELAQDFACSIGGLVATPSTFTLADLEADGAEHVTVVKTMLCVLGYRSTALYTGVPLRVLLDRAGIDRAMAKRVRFFGHDGFENNLRVSDIYDGPPDAFEPLVAFRIHGRALPRELGSPFRLLLCDRYGYKNTKWLARIEVTAEDSEIGQYQARGYPDAGMIEPVPIVENLRVSNRVPAGALELCGFALSGRGGLASVELSLDGAPHRAAELSTLAAQRVLYPELDRVAQLGEPARFGPHPRGVWTAFRATLELGPGMHSVALRAIDTAQNAGQATTLSIEAV
jgi:DMSO/TMAO reductase YedYZ molybdopterin-dependent catalytic subunit